MSGDETFTPREPIETISGPPGMQAEGVMDALGQLPELSQFLSSILHGVLAASGRHEELESAGNAGGYYCIADQGTILPLAIIPVGEIPSDKGAGRAARCIEKAARLSRHPRHDRSWESRDPERDMWGGAVRGRRFIHSFSGLPEELDEVFCCIVACALGDMSKESARRMIGEVFDRYEHLLT